MKGKMVKLVAVFVLLFGVMVTHREAAAYYSPEDIGSVDDIGTFQRRQGGKSHVGVAVYWEDTLVCSALDTWKKLTMYDDSDYDWSYSGSRYQDNVYEMKEDYFPTDVPIGVQSTESRFVLDNDMIRNGRTEYSVIIEKIQQGGSTTMFEINNIPTGMFGTTSTGEASMQGRKATSEISEYSPLASSYIYHIYDVRNIEPGAEISASLNGGKIESPGKAYYNGSGYCLAKLPTASYVKPGYKTVFQGWYDSVTGGTQYQQGDILQEGDTLYARWSIEANEYEVTCVDIAGTDEDGIVLGQSSWKELYDTTVSGAKAGSDTTESAYYAHCRYTGASTATVTVTGTTVYRYFTYQKYPVHYIDQIQSGSRKDEELNSTVKQKDFASTVSGADLGEDSTAGAYYTGYCYTGSTTETVTEEGAEVYRYFKPLEYTIAFDGNGASEGSMQQLTACLYDTETVLPENLFQNTSTITLYQSGEKLEEQTSEIKAVHKFLGWSAAPDGEVQYTNQQKVKNLAQQAEGVTLYAVWSTENVALPSLSNKIGYRFLGWSKTADAQNGFSQLQVQRDTALYAVWEKDVVKYHVEYYKENLNGEYEQTSNYEFEGYSNETVSLQSVDNIYPGFTLDEASSKISGQVKADGSLILCAYYRRNTYEISYDLNGGKVSNGSLPVKEKVKFGKSTVITSVLPEREGCLFLGWSKEADKDEALLTAGDTVVMQNHDMTLYAQWKPISFKVTYDNNAAFSQISGITGSVADTEYICEKDSYASKEAFQAPDATMLAWNSKPDGSGITVLPGTNMKGLFDSCKELTLYAVWQVDSTNTASFQLTICKMGTSAEKTKIDTLTLQGKAGEKIGAALLRIYQNDLAGESAVYFYKGYEVVNTEVLEQAISSDSSTSAAVQVKERTCLVAYQLESNETENQLASVMMGYQETVTLPEKLANGDSIEGFEDSMGNHYTPGSVITLEHNLQLTVQQAIHLHDETAKEKEEIVYVTRGSDYVLPVPQKTGYRFLGWYFENGEKAGNGGDTIQKITKRCDYYAKWSEPLTYQISYDFENLDIKILENNVSYYQYLKGAVLPDSSQVAVPEGYQFAGWYDQEDVEQKIITAISETDYGDKVLRLRLTKKDESTDWEQGEENGSADQQQGDIGEQSDSQPIETIPSDNSGSTAKNNVSENTKTLKTGSVFWKGNLKYQVLSVKKGKRTIRVIGNRWKKKSLSVPKQVTYQSITFRVTEIGAKAFYQSKYITKVTIPNSVTALGSKAFAKMKSLKAVTIGTGGKQIGKQAFQKSEKLAKIVIKSKKISKIGAKAFASISAKAKIYVPKQKKNTYQKLLKASKCKKSIFLIS